MIKKHYDASIATGVKYSMGCRAFIYACLFSLFFANVAIAQNRIGVYYNYGFGSIQSSALNTWMQQTTQSTPNIQSANASSDFGFNMGFGGFFLHKFNNKLSFLTEPSINYLSSQLILNSKTEKLDANKSGVQVRNASVAKLGTVYLQIPLLAKYTFFQKRKLYFIGGASINFNFSPTLKSEETVATTHYAFGRIAESEVNHLPSHSSKMTGFNPIQINAVLGFGRQFRKQFKNLAVDIRYNLPLMASPLYGADADLKNDVHNYAFTETQHKVSTTKLDDFRMGVFTLSVKYTLKKLDKKKSSEDLGEEAAPVDTNDKPVSILGVYDPEQEKQKQKQLAKEAKQKGLQVDSLKNTVESNDLPKTTDSTSVPVKAKKEKKAKKSKKNKDEVKTDSTTTSAPVMDVPKVVDQPAQVSPIVETKVDSLATPEKPKKEKKAKKSKKNKEEVKTDSTTTSAPVMDVPKVVDQPAQVAPAVETKVDSVAITPEKPKKEKKAKKSKKNKEEVKTDSTTIAAPVMDIPKVVDQPAQVAPMIVETKVDSAATPEKPKKEKKAKKSKKNKEEVKTDSTTIAAPVMDIPKVVDQPAQVAPMIVETKVDSAATPEKPKKEKKAKKSKKNKDEVKTDSTTTAAPVMDIPQVVDQPAQVSPSVETKVDSAATPEKPKKEKKAKKSKKNKEEVKTDSTTIAAPVMDIPKVVDQPAQVAPMIVETKVDSAATPEKPKKEKKAKKSKKNKDEVKTDSTTTAAPVMDIPQVVDQPAQVSPSVETKLDSMATPEKPKKEKKAKKSKKNKEEVKTDSTTTSAPLIDVPKVVDQPAQISPSVETNKVDSVATPEKPKKEKKAKKSKRDKEIKDSIATANEQNIQKLADAPLAEIKLDTVVLVDEQKVVEEPKASKPKKEKKAKKSKKNKDEVKTDSTTTSAPVMDVPKVADQPAQVSPSVETKVDSVVTPEKSKKEKKSKKNKKEKEVQSDSATVAPATPSVETKTQEKSTDVDSSSKNEKDNIKGKQPPHAVPDFKAGTSATNDSSADDPLVKKKKKRRNQIEDELEQMIKEEKKKK